MGPREYCNFWRWFQKVCWVVVEELCCLQGCLPNNFSVVNIPSVTVFGHSAGGASVTYLMVSPLAEGLFSKAIAQSGTNLAAWAQPGLDGVAEKRTIKLANLIGCAKSRDWKETVECLRSASASEIIAATHTFFVSLSFCVKSNSIINFQYNCIRNGILIR